MSFVGHEQVEDPELRRREPDAGRPPRGLVGLGIELESVDLDARLGRLDRRELRAPQQSPDAGDELAELERLRQEVIRAKIERPQHVVRVTTARQDEDRRLVRLAHAPEYLESIKAR